MRRNEIDELLKIGKMVEEDRSLHRNLGVTEKWLRDFKPGNVFDLLDRVHMKSLTEGLTSTWLDAVHHGFTSQLKHHEELLGGKLHVHTSRTRFRQCYPRHP